MEGTKCVRAEAKCLLEAIGRCEKQIAEIASNIGVAVFSDNDNAPKNAEDAEPPFLRRVLGEQLDSLTHMEYCLNAIRQEVFLLRELTVGGGLESNIK